MFNLYSIIRHIFQLTWIMPPMNLCLGHVMAMLYWYAYIPSLSLKMWPNMFDVHQFFLMFLRVLAIFLFHYESKRFILKPKIKTGFDLIRSVSVRLTWWIQLYPKLIPNSWRIRLRQSPYPNQWRSCLSLVRYLLRFWLSPIRDEYVANITPFLTWPFSVELILAYLNYRQINKALIRSWMCII